MSDPNPTYTWPTPAEWRASLDQRLAKQGFSIADNWRSLMAAVANKSLGREDTCEAIEWAGEIIANHLRDSNRPLGQVQAALVAMGKAVDMIEGKA